MVVVSPYWLLSCWDAQRLLPLAATKPTQVRDWLDTYNVAHLEDGARLRLEPSQRLLFQPGLLSEPPLRGKVVAVTGFRRPSERGKGPCVDQIHCLIDMLGGCFMSALDLYGGVSRTVRAAVAVPHLATPAVCCVVLLLSEPTAHTWCVATRAAPSTSVPRMSPGSRWCPWTGSS